MLTAEHSRLRRWPPHRPKSSRRAPRDNPDTLKWSRAERRKGDAPWASPANWPYCRSPPSWWAHASASSMVTAPPLPPATSHFDTGRLDVCNVGHLPGLVPDTNPPRRSAERIHPMDPLKDSLYRYEASSPATKIRRRPPHDLPPEVRCAMMRTCLSAHGAGPCAAAPRPPAAVVAAATRRCHRPRDPGPTASHGSRYDAARTLARSAYRSPPIPAGEFRHTADERPPLSVDAPAASG